MKEIKISKKDENQRFDKYLKKYFKGATGGFIYKMLRKKNIVLNGKKDDGSTILNAGDIVNVYFSDETFEKMRCSEESEEYYNYLRSLDYNIDVIYEDDDIISVNKPAGILSQKSKSEDISINEYLISYLINEKGYSIHDYMTFHPSVSNRLDYNTTGVILAAKTLKGQQNLSFALKHRTIDKYYLCIVAGRVEAEMTLKGSLIKDEKTNKVYIRDDNSDDIITKIDPIRYNDNVSLLKIHLITGKTHQIRAHLASVGHPVIGDVKYGDNRQNNIYKKKYNIDSQALHSYITEYEGIKIVAPLPDKMYNLIKEEYGDVEFERA